MIHREDIMGQAHRKHANLTGIPGQDGWLANCLMTHRLSIGKRNIMPTRVHKRVQGQHLTDLHGCHFSKSLLLGELLQELTQVHKETVTKCSV